MGESVDLSVGAPSAPQVSPGVGEPIPEPSKPKRPRSSSKAPPGSEPGPAPTGLDMLDEPLPMVTMDQVRVVVMSAGLMLGMALGDEDVPEHWRFTEAELAALVPPLTTVINRRPALRRAVQRSDEVTIALVLAGYTGRNLDAWRAAKKARGEDQPEVEGGREGEAERVAGRAPAGDAGPGRADGRGRVDRGGVPGPAGGGLG